ncbi:MAG: ABC transporter permease [Chloroflexi bacterium]|nr:ABC transporter permease [Chloroflexota bacterium]
MEDQQISQEDNQSMMDKLSALWRVIAIPLAAVLLALVIGAILLAVSGANPFRAYAALVEGSFGSMKAFGRTLAKATPLIFSGLAVAFAFKAGLFNIGAQGQLLFGALASAAAGFMITGLPPFLHATLALLIGATAGALFAAIPGALKAYTGAHEVITTIMLNYVAINMTDYFADGPFKDRTEGNIVARTPEILDSARIPSIGEIPVGFLLAVLAAIIVWWLLWRTTLGFEIRTVGLSPHAAKYAGMKVAATVILTMVISGVLAGIGGAIETQGIVYRYQPGFNAGLGFDGITIALLGKTHPIGIIPAAILIGAMKAGASTMQFNAGVAKEITDVIQALMLFFVTADIIIRKLIRSKAESGETVTLSGWGQQ